MKTTSEATRKPMAGEWVYWDGSKTLAPRRYQVAEVRGWRTKLQSDPDGSFEWIPTFLLYTPHWGWEDERYGVAGAHVIVDDGALFVRSVFTPHGERFEVWEDRDDGDAKLATFDTFHGAMKAYYAARGDNRVGA